jgi:hypothetical protein
VFEEATGAAVGSAAGPPPASRQLSASTAGTTAVSRRSGRAAASWASAAVSDLTEAASAAAAAVEVEPDADAGTPGTLTTIETGSGARPTATTYSACETTTERPPEARTLISRRWRPSRNLPAGRSEVKPST